MALFIPPLTIIVLLLFCFACFLIQKKGQKMITHSIPIKGAIYPSSVLYILSNWKLNKYNQINLNAIEGIFFSILKTFFILRIFLQLSEV